MEKAVSDAIARRTKWCATQQISAYAKIKDAIIDWTGEDGERLEIDLTEFVANMEEDRTSWLCEYIEGQLERDAVSQRCWSWVDETGDSVVIRFNFFD
jgi:DNA integrity scanning protein DisA with diadenylate cyclase activity